MTALEKLILSASTTGTQETRKVAKEAQVELDKLRGELKRMYEEYWKPITKESCTPTDNVVK